MSGLPNARIVGKQQHTEDIVRAGLLGAQTASYELEGEINPKAFDSARQA